MQDKVTIIFNNFRNSIVLTMELISMVIIPIVYFIAQSKDWFSFLNSS